MCDELGSDDSLELNLPELGSQSEEAVKIYGKPISVGRLHMRLPRQSDANALVALAGNYNVSSQTSNVPYPYDMEQAEDWIAHARRKQPDCCSYVIELLPTADARHEPATTKGQIIGTCRFGQAQAGYTGIEIGYWLGEPFWGNGYAADACHALIDHIFTTTAKLSIWVSCRVTNPQSRRVIEKCGFQYREAGMAYSSALGGMSPVERFVLDRQIWKSLKAWGRADA